MPWTLEEKQGRQALKRGLLAAKGGLSSVTLLVAWLTWDVWSGVQDGERTVASAKNTYQLMIVLVPMAFAFAAVLRPDLGPRPRQPEIRRFAAWAAAAALIWAAMPMAALLTLPVTG